MIEPVNLFGALALIVQCSVLLDRQQRWLIVGTALSLALWAVHFALLEAYPVAVLVTIGLFWYGLCALMRPPAWASVLVILLQFPVALGIELSWSALLSATGSVLFLSAPAIQAGLTRRFLIGGGQSCFIAIGVLIGSPWAITSDGIQLLSNVVGGVREFRYRKVCELTY